MALRSLLLAALLCASAGRADTDAEERVLAWVRANGGNVSETIGFATTGGQRSIVAFEAIPNSTMLFQIPPELWLVPKAEARKSELMRSIKRIKGMNLDDAAFAVHIVRQVERSQEAHAAGREAGFHSPFWESLGRHLDLMDNMVDLWEPEEQEMLGASEVSRLKSDAEAYDYAHALIRQHFGVDSSVLGTLDSSRFKQALFMFWSRRFNDWVAGVMVPSIMCINHHIPRIANVEFERKDHVFEAWAKKDIAKGEELTISYGNLPSDEMLKVYGFTTPPGSEPNFFFTVSQAQARREVLPNLTVSQVQARRLAGAAPPAVFELSTPFLDERDENQEYWTTWDAELKNELVLLKMAGLDGLDRLVDFYADQLASLPLLAPFVAQLSRNRLQNRRSHVWWADLTSADSMDLSSADALGSRRRSDAVRVRMSHYLSLLVWQETLLLRRGKFKAEDALASSVKMLPYLEVVLDKFLAAERGKNQEL